jgi:putative mycofactocin binding protein MftB
VSFGIDPDAAYRLHPNVAVRPEPFGALVYHYGNRKLVFLKSPRMVAVVKALDDAPSVAAALDAQGVAPKNRDRYLVALNSLLASDMLVPSETHEVSVLVDQSKSGRTLRPAEASMLVDQLKSGRTLRPAEASHAC